MLRRSSAPIFRWAEACSPWWWLTRSWPIRADEMFGRSSVWFETPKFEHLEEVDVKQYIQLVPCCWNFSNFHAIEQLNWVLLSTRVLHGRV